MSANPLEAVAGFLLVFFLPGYAVSRAVFPEWRVRGERGLERGVELLTLSLIVSVVLTILLGFALLQTSVGFQAGWSDPLLETALAAVATLAFVVGVFRGSYRRVPVPHHVPEDAPDTQGAWELVRDLEAKERELRRLRHALRSTRPGSPEAGELAERQQRLEVQRGELLRAREAEYAR
jgi:hypothetical protein